MPQFTIGYDETLDVLEALKARAESFEDAAAGTMGPRREGHGGWSENTAHMFRWFNRRAAVNDDIGEAIRAQAGVLRL